MKAAIIGCGNIARTHVFALRQMKEVSLCGFADIRPERAEALALYQGVKDGNERSMCYSTFEEMVETVKPDVVHICTPHYLHVPMAVWLLQRGIHVFMEKPPAINREQMNALEAAEGTSGASLGICFQNRYNRTTREVDRILQEGSMGELLGARAFVTWNRSRAYYTDSGWRGTPEKEGGGILINQAIHTLDLLVHWLGHPTIVEASMANHHLKGMIEVEDTVEAYIQFGKMAACFYGMTAYKQDAPVLIELICEKGSIRLEGTHVISRYIDGREVCCRYEAADAVGKAYWGEGHRACIEDFYQCLAKDRSGPPEKKQYENDLDSVKHTMDLMFGIYESAQTGACVSLGKESKEV